MPPSLIRRVGFAAAAVAFGCAGLLVASAPAATGELLVDCQYPVVGAGVFKDGGGIEVDPSDPGYAWVSLAPWSTDADHTTVGRQIAAVDTWGMQSGYTDGSKACPLDSPPLYTSDQAYSFGALAINPVNSDLFGAERTTESSPTGAAISANVDALTSAGGTSIHASAAGDYNYDYVAQVPSGSAAWSLDGAGATAMLLPALALDPADGAFWIARTSWSFDAQGPHNVCNVGGGLCTDIYKFEPTSPWKPYNTSQSFGVLGHVGGLATDPVDQTLWATFRTASGGTRQACQYGVGLNGHAAGVQVGACVTLTGATVGTSLQPGDASVDNCTFYPRKALWVMVTGTSGWPYVQAYDVGTTSTKPANCVKPPDPSPDATPSGSTSSGGGSSNSLASLPATPDGVRIVAPAFDPIFRPPWVPASTPLYFPDQALTFDVTSLLDPTGRTLVYKWDFDGPNGPMVAQVLPGRTDHTYLVPGFYDLVVTVTNAKTGKVVAVVRKPLSINFGFGSYTTVGDSRTVPVSAMSGANTLLFKLGELSKGTGGSAVTNVTWVINGVKFGPVSASTVVRAPAKRKTIRPRPKKGQGKKPKTVTQKATSAVKWSVKHKDGTTITRSSPMFG